MRKKSKFFIAVMLGGLIAYGQLPGAWQAASQASWWDWFRSRDAGSEMPLSGRVVYAVSDKVLEYDLVSGERRELYRHGGIMTSRISKVDESSFIVESGASMLLVRERGEAHFLSYPAGNTVFFPAHGKLLYLQIVPGKSRVHLHEAVLRDNRLESPRVVAEAPLSTGHAMVAMSDDELLVWRGDRDGPYTKYDLRTGSLAETQIRKCIHVYAWRSRTQEAICLGSDEGSGYVHVLVGLDGRRRPVPGLSGMTVGAYSPEGDYVLGNRGPSHGGGDLYSYHFSTGAVRQIAKKGVRIGKAFWSPRRRGTEYGHTDRHGLMLALLDAVDTREVAAIDALVKAGADVNVKDKKGRTALHAAAHSGKVEAIDVLLKAGADVNAKDGKGWTPVFHAADSEQVAAIDALVKAGADVNVKDKKGRTALHAAAHSGKVEAIGVLLKAGAEVNVKDKDGGTALSVARSSGVMAVIRALKLHGGR